MAKVAEWRMGNFSAQGLANIAWSFAMVAQSDVPMFAVLARAAERSIDEFNAQELANTAWALTESAEGVLRVHKAKPKEGCLGCMDQGTIS